MGAASITDTIPAFALSLYAAGLFWTLGYDTIYAQQDMTDDALIGIKSTALKFGKISAFYSAGFYILTAALLCAFGNLSGDDRTRVDRIGTGHNPPILANQNMGSTRPSLIFKDLS